MRILAIKPTAYLPYEVSGANKSFDVILRHLYELGHEVSLLCADSRGPIVSMPPPYPVFPSSNVRESLQRALIDRRNDLAIIYGSGDSPYLAGLIAGSNTPLINFCSTASFETMSGAFTRSSLVRHVVASRFTATKFKAWYGIEPDIIRPIVEQRAVNPNVVGDAILFVNPVPQKGLFTACAIANEIPASRFIFAESWALTEGWRKYAQRFAPPNVEWHSPVADIVDLLEQSRAVIVQSVWEESWGRIVSEAQLAGVPVIASDRGGLPEAVGIGGQSLRLVEPISHWINKLNDLIHVKELHENWSNAGREEARNSPQRSELISMWLNVVCEISLKRI